MRKRLRFKFLREEAKKTQADIAAQLNLTQSAYSAWERGKRSPDVEGLYTLADIFDTSIDYMLGYSRNRAVDGGKPERLLLEFLKVQHSFQPDAEQLVLIADLIGTSVKMLQNK